ncbi:Uncharacterised protein [Bordetella pertussis]|nr:Uncharacterised protein [Bordetella pertussis]
MNCSTPNTHDSATIAQYGSTIQPQHGAGSGVGGCERAVTAIGTRHSTRHMATRVSGPSSSVA